jgi:hypothetical protein
MKGKVQFFKILFFAILSLTVVISLTGCGGGGGGGSSDGGGSGGGASLSSTNAPMAASAVSQAAQFVQFKGAMDMVGDVLKTSSISTKNPSNTSLISIFNKMLSISKAQTHKSELHVAGSIPSETLQCPDGGTVNVSVTWTGPDEPEDPSQVVDLTATMTFGSCKEEDNIMAGTVTIAFSGSLSNPTKFTFSTSEFTVTDLPSDVITLTDFKMDITDIHITDYELTKATLTMSGKVSNTKTGKLVNIECDNFKVVGETVSNGEKMTISGRIKPSCIDGWVTISTNTPVFIAEDADCPTAGEVVATSGGNRVKMVIASDSTIRIYFNNTLVQTYNDCEGVDGLCVG